jgi:hypothetical protein
MDVEQLQENLAALEVRVVAYKAWVEEVTELEEKILNEGSSGLEVSHVQLSDQKKLHVPSSSDLLRRVQKLESELELIKSRLAALI